MIAKLKSVSSRVAPMKLARSRTALVNLAGPLSFDGPRSAPLKQGRSILVGEDSAAELGVLKVGVLERARQVGVEIVVGQILATVVRPLTLQVGGAARLALPVNTWATAKASSSAVAAGSSLKAPRQPLWRNEVRAEAAPDCAFPASTAPVYRYYDHWKTRCHRIMTAPRSPKETRQPGKLFSRLRDLNQPKCGGRHNRAWRNDFVKMA